MQTHDKPPIITEIEKELAIIKERLRIVEDALKELTLCYDSLRNTDSTR